MRRPLSNGLLLLLGLGVFGCGSDSGTGGFNVPSGGGGSSSDGGGGGGLASISSGPNFLDVSRFPFNQLRDGGPGKDGIPALTDPPLSDPGDVGASYVRETDIVMGVVINGEARAYPHNIGWHHEIVNDVVGGKPIVATLCPLTETGMVFNGEGADGNRIGMGVLGLLFNNNLVMYDRRDGETLYPQMTFKGSSGPRAGEELELLPVVETSWRYWKQLYPNTKVVSGNNGVYPLGQYLTYPYGGYQSLQSSPFYETFPPLASNPLVQRHEPKRLTLGIRFGEEAKAYPFPSLLTNNLINDNVAGNEIVVVSHMAEAFTVAYFSKVDGRTLTFEEITSGSSIFPFWMKDKETGSSWNLLGEAFDGELKGKQLQQVPSHNAFWFAWATFWQDSETYQ